MSSIARSLIFKTRKEKNGLQKGVYGKAGKFVYKEGGRSYVTPTKLRKMTP